MTANRWTSKGLSLIELIVALALILVALAIAFPMWDQFNRLSTTQLREHGERSDVLVATSFLMQDIHYAKALSVIHDNQLSVTVKDGSLVNYSLQTRDGKAYLVRENSGQEQAFLEIYDIRFTLENADLVNINFFTNRANPQTADVKISKWGYSFASPANFIADQKIFVLSSRFYFSGSEINGPNETLYIKGGLETHDLNGGNFTNVKTIYIDGNVLLDGGSAGMGYKDNTGLIIVDGDMTLWSGTREIYGDVYVSGDFKLKDAKIYGNVYVKGNLELGWTPQISGKIEYEGTLTKPNNYNQGVLSKCTKVSSVKTNQIPAYEIPGLRPDDWYRSHGYYSGGMLANGIKIFATNYSSNDWVSSKDVVVVSKGDITFNGWRNISGVLFAPYGKITMNIASFTGVAISRDGVFMTSGGSKINSKNITEMIADPADYPFGGSP